MAKEDVLREFMALEKRGAELRHPLASVSAVGPGAVGKITASREADGRQSTSIRYFFASWPIAADELNRLARGHWGIENQLHWVLDVVMNEDLARARKDNAPENPALLRRLALNIIKRNKDTGSNRLKFNRAGWNDNFLRKLISEIA